jgi:hypothetical protein
VPKKLRKNRPTERAAVNSVQTFFELHNHLFQPVNLENDIGKDAYIDLSEGNDPSGLCLAVQIKGGSQTTRTTRKGETRGIPFTRNDAELYRASNIPVFGMAHKDNDAGIHWVNLSEYCRWRASEGDLRGGFAPAEGLLTKYSLPQFIEVVRRVTKHEIAVAWGLIDDDPAIQSAALADCLGLARRDYRPLLLIRKLLDSWSGEPLLRAVWVISHAVYVPDRFSGVHNWLAPEVQQRLRNTFSWSIQEIELLLTVLDEDSEMFGRGVAGQCVSAVLLADKDVGTKLFNIARLKGAALAARARAVIYLVHMCDDEDTAKYMVGLLLRLAPDLLDSTYFRDVYEHVMDAGYINVYDD